MEKLSHAYIVSCASVQKGMEKATELAAKMLCSSEGARPCGACRDCRKLRSGVHPDLSVISRLCDDKGNLKSSILIEQIRDMRADASVLPNEAHGKVYIIREADTMNDKAQNAALKIFEEPPADVFFILVTSNPEKLLTTVRSRCALLRCAADEVQESDEASALADEYIGLIRKGDAAELFAWCADNEGLDAHKLPDFLFCVRHKLIGLMRYSEDRKPLMDNIALIDRCIEYQAVNTGVKHIFGLLAVCSLPAKETRKRID